MLGRFHQRRCAGQRRVRVFQIGRRIHGAANFAGIAVLILRTAFRTLALDVAVGQEHVFYRIVELFDRAGRDQLRVIAQATIDFLRQLMVLRAVGRMPVVESDVETVEILLATGRDFRDEFLWRDARFFSGDHDRRAMRVIGANEIYLMPAHAHEAHPDVGLDVLHDVADMEGTIRIRQRGGHEKLAGRGGGCGDAHCQRGLNWGNRDSSSRTARRPSR